MTDDKILRARDVSKKVGLSRSTIYRLIKLGKFPPSQIIGLQAVGWKASAIESWIDGTHNTAPTRQAIPAAPQ
ncbi:MAG: AlpA family phage regulatory protein [Proteobacteria bacterium]|nr:AlpA family phage regulatory protein [Pseudomonadota bacterium]MCL2306804.1 AlpA family phage regulatory protein [Pseudomonadota bacterium]